MSISTDPSADYRASGQAVARFLVERCQLQPDQAVLDVGCGVGRTAAALGTYLLPSARYEGFDIVDKEIAWCRSHLSARFPNFRFQTADVFNQFYNRSGQTPAAAFSFPYADRTFDCAVVASVFTHMLEAGVARYIHEIARVLKPGGRCLASFYLLNRESLAGIVEGTSTFTFAHSVDGCVVEDRHDPEVAVAYAEAKCRALFADSGLTIDEVVYGSWSSERNQTQDLVIASRPI